MSTEAKIECTKCGREFPSKKSLAGHKAAGHDKPWMDEETLRREYVDKERSSYELAEEWGCDSKTVRNWLERFGLDRRKAKHYNRVESAFYNTSPEGYERWQLHYGEDRGKTVYVHRLAAVAWFGLEPVKNKHVHHEDGVRWDNREDNITMKTPSEHAKDHYEQGDLKIRPNGAAEEMEGTL